MRPKVKSIISPDLEYPNSPPHPSHCRILVEVEIGPADSTGADIFSFEVITRSKFEECEDRWGRGLLILERFSWNAINQHLDKLFLHCDGKDWEEISHKLNKELHWEFENYRDTP